MPKCRELLAESHRGSVLQVSSSDLVNMSKLMRLSLELISQCLETWQQFLISLEDCCNVHDCWKAIVARLASVDMVIGMD